jgi:hypothetical protein
VRTLRIATLSILLVAANSRVCLAGGTTGGNEEPSGSSGQAQVSTWVVGATNGGVTPPAGASSCTPWAIFDASTTEGGADPHAPTVNPNTGEPATVYVRQCDGQYQYVYVGPQDPEDVADYAYDKVVSLVPDPEVAFSPPIDKMIVNFETWLGITPSPPITATATIPNLSATVTAEPTSIEWVTGSQVAGDTTLITCRPWGSTRSAQDGCSWIPKYPSVEKVTGTTDQRYHGTVTIVWEVSWQASNGASGDLGELRTTTDIKMVVQEIQTIGG